MQPNKYIDNLNGVQIILFIALGTLHMLLNRWYCCLTKHHM